MKQHSEYVKLGFRGESHRIFIIIHCFGKHCSCHLQGEFWKVHIRNAVGGELDVMVLIGLAEEQPA
jgi:hypothetical protein